MTSEDDLQQLLRKERACSLRNLALQARHFAYGNIGCVVEWLRGDIEATPEQLASDMFACMPADLRKAYAASEGLR